MSLRKGDPVEVCSEEEGFKGAWFPATIVRKAGSGFLVEFRDLVTDDEKSKLREKVEANQIRPQPPSLNRERFMLHEKVDVYDQDGWWLGVIDSVVANNNKYLVYFNETDEKLEYNVSQLRLHLDWVDGKWFQRSKNEVTEQLHPVPPPLPLPSCQENTENITKEVHPVPPPACHENTENITKEVHPAPLRACHENTESISKTERRSTRANKWQSKTSVRGISAKGKADSQSVTLQNSASQLTERSGKRRRVSKDRLDDASHGRKKIDIAGRDVESAETFCPSKDKRIIHLPDSPAYFSKETEVTFSEAQQEETKPILHAMGGKREAHGASDSHSTAEKNIVIAIPSPEDIGKTTGCPSNTRETSAKENLKGIELHAYHSVLKALYLQGPHTWKIEFLLTDLREVLHISHEEHASELRNITSAQYK